MDGFSDKFKELWQNKVWQQIKICTPEYANIRKLESGRLSTEEKDKLIAEIREKDYKDIEGQYYIGELVCVVEHALADNRKNLNFVQHMMQVHGCLNDDSYWTNVFENDFSSNEAKELLKLKGLINELYKLI